MKSIKSFVLERLNLNSDSKVKKDDTWYFVVPGYSPDEEPFIELKKTYSKSYVNGSIDHQPGFLFNKKEFEDFKSNIKRSVYNELWIWIVPKDKVENFAKNWHDAVLDYDDLKNKKALF